MSRGTRPRDFASDLSQATSELTIGQVAKRTGLRASAIRYYEAEGLIPRGRRRGGKRIFDPAVLDRIALIDLAKASGFTIAETRRLLYGFSRRTPPGARWRALAAEKSREIDQRIEQAIRMKRVLQAIGGCDCPTLEDCGKAMRAGEGAP